MRRLSTLMMLVILGAAAVRTQGPTSTNGQLNGWAWTQMSNEVKLSYLDGVEAGFSEGWLGAAGNSPRPCVGPVPTQIINREGVVHDIDSFYTVTENLPTPIASAYVQTRRNLRDDLHKP